MASGFFVKAGPPELVLRILAHCDSLQDAWNLAFTCRHMFDIWGANNAGARLVWRFWLRGLPCADEALIAVRAAQLVLDAEERDELPPKAIKLHQLSSRKSMPSTLELNAVWDLQCLARSIECVLLSDELTLPKDMQGKYANGAPEDPDRMPEWRRGLGMAIYRSLIAGAALAGVYQEPLREGKKTNIPELQSLTEAHFSENQLSFIKKFTVFQTVTTLEQETPLFASFGQWLLENILSDTDARHAMAERFEKCFGRAITCSGQVPDALACPLHITFEGNHSDAHFVVWELMKMFWMQERLFGDIGSEYIDLTEDNITTPIGKAPVVLFRYFTAMKINGPSLSASPPIDSSLEDNPNSLARLLNRIHEDSGQPNRYEQGLEVAPLHAKFFQYFLRRYFGIRFHLGFFNYEEEAADRDPTYSSFTQSLAIFSHDDIKGRSASCRADNMPYVDFMSGSEILEPANTPVDCWSTSD